MKAIHFLMESIRRGRPVTEAELNEARERCESAEASKTLEHSKGDAHAK